ncbi:MAG: epoxyqueuosine reductase QueH [Lachnospiraceae bacterium]|nr:epoxyqueuosine reductase QueH [Lachnospiraceae bacterium]
MNINYQKELDIIIEENSKKGVKPRLILHSCCAPCTSYCIEYLNRYFDITLYFYNPNISNEEEYNKRAKELIRLIKEMKLDNQIECIIEKYESEEFYKVAKGLEKEPERGARCTECFLLRLNKSAIYAKEKGVDYFTTTLTISPHKNAVLLNEIGKKLGDEYGVNYLYSDFKKKNGYKRSIELSSEYNLYRQDFCGCIYSKVERERQKRETL